MIIKATLVRLLLRFVFYYNSGIRHSSRGLFPKSVLDVKLGRGGGNTPVLFSRERTSPTHHHPRIPARLLVGSVFPSSRPLPEDRRKEGTDPIKIFIIVERDFWFLIPKLVVDIPHGGVYGTRNNYIIDHTHGAGTLAPS